MSTNSGEITLLIKIPRTLETKSLKINLDEVVTVEQLKNKIKSDLLKGIRIKENILLFKGDNVEITDKQLDRNARLQAESNEVIRYTMMFNEINKLLDVESGFEIGETMFGRSSHYATPRQADIFKMSKTIPESKIAHVPSAFVTQFQSPLPNMSSPPIAPSVLLSSPSTSIFYGSPAHHDEMLRINRIIERLMELGVTHDNKIYDKLYELKYRHSINERQEINNTLDELRREEIFQEDEILMRWLEALSEYINSL